MSALFTDPRRRILGVLSARPGLSSTDLARELGVDVTTVSYHLRRLEREGLVAPDGRARTRRWSCAGSFAQEARSQLLAEQLPGDILAAVRGKPGGSKATLAQRLAISRAAFEWHVERLERAGLVRAERAGRRVLLYPISFS